MLNPDFRDILSVFIEEEVEFLLVGAYALAAHGLPRATGDIDLWVHAHAENAERVCRALARFGAPMHAIGPKDFKQPDVVFQVGVVPRRIDVMTAISGVAFDAAWPSRVEVEIGGLKIPVLSRQDLIVNKRTTGRLKDLADVQWLENKGDD